MRQWGFVVCGRLVLSHFFATGVLTGLVLLSAPPSRLAAQQPAPQISPEDFGLEIPTTGAVRQGEGRRVLVKNDADEEVVALVHVDIGDRRLVILPNGRLVSLEMSDTRPTKDEFKPATAKQVAAELTSGPFKGFKSRATNHFVYVYNTSEEFQKATSRILETMLPGVVAFYKRQKTADVHEPLMPLIVVMFKTEEEFQKYQQMPEGVVAYYNGVSNRVVMYEQSSLMQVAPDLAIKQSISTIAHEGVHQILHNIGVQHRLSRWPMWISEGLPEYFSPTSTGARLKWKGVGQVNDMRMYELEQYLKQRGANAEPGELVKRAVESARFDSLEYAVSWALVHYLAARQKDELLDYLKEVSQMQPFGGMNLAESEASVSGHAKLFAQHFGDDYAKLEADLIKYLQKLPYTNPVENQTHYVAMGIVQTGGGTQRTAVVTTSPAAVQMWQQQVNAQLPSGGRATFQVRPFANRSLAREYMQQWVNQ